MARQVVRKIKLQIPAGKATPAPPVATALGPVGVNLQEFCTRYNDATREQIGSIVPVEISVYDDRSFEFVLKTPPATDLLLKAAGLEKGSKKGANEIVATITKADLKKIAEIKMPDLNSNDLEKAMKIIEGTARNMGIAIKGVNDLEMAEQGAEAAEAEKVMAKMEAELESMEEAVKEYADRGEESKENEETTETEEETENK